MAFACCYSGTCRTCYILHVAVSILVEPFLYSAIFVSFSDRVRIPGVTFKALESLLAFIYSNQLIATEDIIPELKQLCMQLLVPHFKAKVAAYKAHLHPKICQGNVLQILRDAHAEKKTRLSDECLKLYACFVTTVFLIYFAQMSFTS